MVSEIALVNLNAFILLKLKDLILLANAIITPSTPVSSVSSSILLSKVLIISTNSSSLFFLAPTFFENLSSNFLKYIQKYIIIYIKIIIIC